MGHVQTRAVCAGTPREQGFPLFQQFSVLTEHMAQQQYHRVPVDNCDLYLRSNPDTAEWELDNPTAAQQHKLWPEWLSCSPPPPKRRTLHTLRHHVCLVCNLQRSRVIFADSATHGGLSFPHGTVVQSVSRLLTGDLFLPNPKPSIHCISQTGLFPTT